MRKIKINNDPKKVFVKDLKSNPIYKFKDKIGLPAVNFLIANEYNYEEVAEFIQNAQNVNFSYKKFEEFCKKECDINKSYEFKILGYFYIDENKNQLVQIGKKNEFSIDLNTVPLDKGDSSVIDMPFYAIITLVKLNNTTKLDINYKVKKIEFVEALQFDIEHYKNLRSSYSTVEWMNLVIKSIGYNPLKFTSFEKFNFLFRLILFCTEKFNYLELGNKNTGKSFFFQELSERHTSLVSPATLTIAKLVYDNGYNEEGLIATKNIIALDEVVDVHLKNKEISEAFQTYFQDGKIARDKHMIRGKASVTFLGNIKDVENSLINCTPLFNQIKMRIENETTYDKFHYFSPSWKMGTINYDKLCDDSEERLSLDFFINSLNKLRDDDKFYDDIVDKFISIEGTFSGRDERIKKAIAGLIKILHPDGNITKEEVEIYTYLAVSGRKLILDQLNSINKDEYSNNLYATSKIDFKEITADNYYNFSILLSENLFSKYDLSLEDVEYYYYDNTYFDENKKNDTRYYNAHDLNKKLRFELIEPRLAIKFKRNKNIYKLALSSYGVNANTLEYHNKHLNKGVNIDFLDNNFLLIKSDCYDKPTTTYKLKHHSNIHLERLKSDNINNPTITALINMFETNHKNLTLALEDNIELKEKTENLENQLLDTGNTLKNVIYSHTDNCQHLQNLKMDFASHSHVASNYHPYTSIPVYPQALPQPLPQVPYVNQLPVAQPIAIATSEEVLTIFDLDKIQNLKMQYIKNKTK